MLTIEAKQSVDKVINKFLLQALQEGFILKATEIQNEEGYGIMNLQREGSNSCLKEFAIIHYCEDNNKLYGHHVRVDYEQGVYGFQVDADCEKEYKKHCFIRLKKFDNA